MQTFLPYTDFKQTAQTLDYRRLGKQRIEAYQILRALNGETKGWRNHPAVKMWDGYEVALCFYGIAMCKEWIDRGYKDTLKERFDEILEDRLFQQKTIMPSWLNDHALTISHQSNLVRKYPEFYKHLWPEVPNDLPYYWPTNRVDNFDNMGVNSDLSS